MVTARAGNGNAAFGGDNGPASNAALAGPYEVTFDTNGNLFIADTFNHRIRKVNSDGLITTVAGSGTSGFSGDGGPAQSARLDGPQGVAVDRNGNLFIADSGNSRIRKVDTSGTITTIAGNGQCCGTGDNGPASSARIGFPYGIAVDATGNLYVAEFFGHRIRRIAANGTITTIAGNGESGFRGDGGLANVARLLLPGSITLASDGSLYFTDIGNHRVRKLSPLVPAGLSIAGGNEQTAPAGAALPSPMMVKVTTRDGTGVPGVPVNFTVTTGAASLSAASVVTGLEGTASVIVTLGGTAGELAVRASVTLGTGVQEVRLVATATAGGPVVGPQPRIASGGITSGGGSTPPLGVLAVNSQAYVSGEGFAPTGTSRTLGLTDLVEGRLPEVLNGVCILVGGVAAPVFSVTPTRVGFIVPTVAVGSAAVQVIAACGGIEERKSNEESVTLQDASPEFFYAGGGEDGHRPVLIRDLDGVRISGATPGGSVVLTLTGLGATDPATVPGTVGSAPLIEMPSVVIDGTALAPEHILFAGTSAAFPGLYELRIKVPETLAEGARTIAVIVGGVSTVEGVTIAVSNPPAVN